MKCLLTWLSILLLLPFLEGKELASPPGIYAFKTYGPQEGLSNISISSMAQDANGSFWVGTEDGLFRLEGARFRQLTPAEGFPKGWSLIDDLAPGSRHGLWIATRHGCAFWDGRRMLHPSDLGLKDMDAARGTPLSQDGGIVLLNLKQKHYYLSLDGEPFKQLDLAWHGPVSAATYRMDKDILLFAFQWDLWMYRNGTWRTRSIPKTFSTGVEGLWVDEQSRIWLRGKDQIAYIDDFQDELHPLAVSGNLGTIQASDLGIDASGRLWANGNDGIFWNHEGSQGVINHLKGLPLGATTRLLVDRQGTVWAGGSGVHKLLGDGIWRGYTRYQGLPHDVIWSIRRTQDGRIWAGSAAGLAYGDSESWTTLPGTRSSQFYCLTEDDDGNLWAGHTSSKEHPSVLGVCAPGSDELIPVDLKGFGKNRPVTAIAGRGDRLYIGLAFGGLIQAKRNQRSISEIEAFGPWQKLALINHLQCDDKEGLWVASSQGLKHWDGATWATLEESNGLPSNQVLTVASMPDGEAWITFRESQGLMRVRRSATRLDIVERIQPPHPLLTHPIMHISYQRGKQLRHNSLHGGTLWISTSWGLLRWDGKNVLRFGKHSGFPGEDCAEKAVWFDPNGDVWVGLAVGMAYGRLGNGIPNLAPPAATIFDIKRSDGLSLNLDRAQSIPYQHRALSFHYGPVGTRFTDDIHYQIKLWGSDTTWRDIPLPEAHYAGLEPGSYRFEVRVISSTGHVGESKSYAFSIHGPWWQKTWFVVLCVMAAFGLVYLAFSIRTRLLRKQNEQLERLVHARTQALESANQELESANSALAEASLSDPLTGLRNRRYLEIAIPDEVNRIYRTYAGLIQKELDPLERAEDMVVFLLDLDHFKAVNDEHGHAAGDAVLQQFAERIRNATRASDALVRWGGEEFMVLALRIQRTNAPTLALNLLESVRNEPFDLPDGQKLHKTCSIGFAAFPMHPYHPELGSWHQTIEVADQCMYAAKHTGRNRWVGVFVRPDAPSEPFETLEGWDMGWALANDLVEAKCSEADFIWK